MEELLHLWPIIAYMLGGSIVSIWWAATAQAAINTLKDDMVLTKDHGNRMIKLETTLFHMDDKLTYLIEATKSSNSRNTRRST